MSPVATGIGSMPGTDFAETLRTVLGELPDLPHVPELPARGVHAGMVGRSLGVVAALGADLVPDGWRLTGSEASGVDHRRARSLLAQDLDTVEEQARELAGRLKLQVTGPWTLAATVEKPRGDRVLSDHGARRELGAALADGVVGHLADVRRRVPGAQLVLQLDEPALPAVLGGRVPTASGLHRHRSVDLPEASALLEQVLAAARDAGATTVVHCCAPDAPLGLLTGAGADGVSVDLGVLGTASYDLLAELLEAGRPVHLGVVPGADPDPWPAGPATTDKVLRLLDMLGLEPAAVPSLVLTPACGLAGASPAWAREALRLVRAVASNLSA